MNDREIRGWLLQQPRAAVVRVTDCDGAQHRIECNGMSWARIAESVHALQPELVEALGPKDTLLRACRPQETGDEEEGEAPSSPKAKAAKPGPLPSVSDLEPFARMLADAYKHSTSLAFDKLVELYNASNERLLSLERMQQREMERKERELAQREAELEEREEEGSTGSGDLMTDMVSAFVGNAAQAPAPASVATSPASSANGKAKPNGKPNGGKA